MLIMDERDRERPRAGRGGGPSSRGSRGSISSYFTSNSRQRGSSPRPRNQSEDAQRPSQNGNGTHRGGHRHRGGRDRDRISERGGDRNRGRERDARHSRIEVPRAAYPPGQRDALKADAQESLRILPQILGQLGTQSRAQEVVVLDPFSLPAISPGRRPRYTQPTAIRVINSDTLNAAIELLHWPAAVLQGTPRPLIVNFASHARPGGGWLNGALAQEEAVCYRSSLFLSLKETTYPLGREDILYSPYVLVVRSDRTSGHNTLTFSVAPHLLPVVSAVSVAALRHPPLRSVSSNSPPVFAYETDRFETKLKMRMTLRAAASRGHDQLVLGALGCGVFGNPPEDVARCWLEVLQEPEFKVVTQTVDGDEEVRYWWKDVVFAIYDGASGQGLTDIGAQGGGSRSNLDTFHQVLDGHMV